MKYKSIQSSSFSVMHSEFALRFDEVIVCKAGKVQSANHRIHYIVCAQQIDPYKITTSLK